MFLPDITIDYSSIDLANPVDWDAYRAIVGDPPIIWSLALPQLNSSRWYNLARKRVLDLDYADSVGANNFLVNKYDVSSYAPASPTRAGAYGGGGYGSWGRVTAIDGVTYAKLSGWIYRTSSASKMGLGRCESTSSRFAIAPFSDGNVYFCVDTGGGQAYGNCAFSTLGWHYFEMTFDGSQSGNANRLVAAIDGIPKTLSYSGTIPAAIVSANENFTFARVNAASESGFYDDVTLTIGRRISTYEISQRGYPDILRRLPGRSWFFVASASGISADAGQGLLDLTALAPSVTKSAEAGIGLVKGTAVAATVAKAADAGLGAVDLTGIVTTAAKGASSVSGLWSLVSGQVTAAHAAALATGSWLVAPVAPATSKLAAAGLGLVEFVGLEATGGIVSFPKFPMEATFVRAPTWGRLRRAGS